MSSERVELLPENRSIRVVDGTPMVVVETVAEPPVAALAPERGWLLRLRGGALDGRCALSTSIFGPGPEIEILWDRGDSQGSLFFTYVRQQNHPDGVPVYGPEPRTRARRR